MNIYLRELKANRKSIVIWTIVMVIYVYMGMQKYEALLGTNDSIVEFMKMMDALPKMIQSMLGLSELDITTPMGYFGVLSFYLVLMAAIHAGMIGSNIIAKEEKDKTAEFLMVKPVSRNEIITSKLLAALTNVVVVNLAISISSVIYLKTLTTETIANEMLLFIAGMLFTQIIFLVIGIGIASVINNPKKANMITMSILLGSFVLSLIIDMTDSLGMIKIITPFKYFEFKELLLTSSLNIWYIILTLIIVVGGLVSSYVRYKKRDLNI